MGARNKVKSNAVRGATLFFGKPGWVILYPTLWIQSVNLTYIRRWKTSKTSFEHLMYVHFTACVQVERLLESGLKTKRNSIIFWKTAMSPPLPNTLDIGRKLKVHKIYKRHPKHLLKILYTLILCSVSSGNIYWKNF